MTKTTIKAGSALGLLLIGGLLTVAMSWVFFAQPTQGSVSVTDEYRATSTGLFLSGAGVQDAIMFIKTRQATLGSIVVTGATTGEIYVYDATTTDATERAAAQSTSSIQVAHLPASTVAGTYTFDIQMNRGLIVEITGSAPTTTITYR